MEIGIFQLENLLLTGSRFQFLRLDQKPLTDPQTDKLVARATALESAEVLGFLAKNMPNKEYPIVLVASDVALLKAQAQTVEGAGYNNIYWLGL